MLQIVDLEVYGLRPLSLELAQGTCLAVEGPSGAGKTVFLRAIADLDPATGTVRLDGLDRNDVTGPQWRRKVRFLAAEPGWWADTPRPHFSSEHDSVSLIEALGLPADILDRPVAQLSTGERLRLALARGVLDDPDVVLLDEPTGALDPKSEERAEDLIRQLLAKGRIVIIVTHDEAQAERLGCRRMRIENGAAQLQGVQTSPAC